jgi:hypothetical protein
MKLLNLKFLNKFCRKHIFSILLGFMTMFKKNTPTIAILAIILSLFGDKILVNCDDNCDDKASNTCSDKNSSQSDRKWSSILKEKMTNTFNNDKSFNKNDNNKQFGKWVKTEEESVISEYNNKDNNNIDNSDDEEYEDVEFNLINEKNNKTSNRINIKKNINKINVKVANKPLMKNNNEKWHKCNMKELYNNYEEDTRDDFKLVVSDANKQLLIQNLRTYSNIDFYFKFYISEYNNKKINDLMMLKDIQSWMTNCTISNDDFKNTCIPIYIITKDHKTDNEVMVFEIYKMFFYEKEEGIKNCFISKGTNWVAVQEVISILHNFGYIKDLLNGKEYDSYNLANNVELCSFLDNLLSVYMLSNSKEDDVVYLDMNENCDNKTTFDYLYHTTNSDINNINIDSLTTI